MRRGFLAGLLLCGMVSAADAPGIYTQNFEKAAIGRVPDDITVLDGTFAVRRIDNNNCLELAGDPLGTFGALYGPEGIAAMDVRARVQAFSTGRRFPDFGIGADDAGGYRLLLIPGHRQLELRHGERTLAAVPAKWTDGSWTWMRLRVEPADGGSWSVRGRVWPQGQPEPAEWSIAVKEAKAPAPGRASLWSDDFSEKPVRWDDLSVTPIRP